jgi:hypothetical protein
VTSWQRIVSPQDVPYWAYLATEVPKYKKFFITGPGTIWFTHVGVEANPQDYRDFLGGGWKVEEEVAAVLDPWYKRTGRAVAKELTSSEPLTEHESPAFIQFIADLIPLMAVAKMIALVKDNQPLYAKSGTKATVLDWIDAFVDVTGALGDLVKVSLKGTKIARMAAAPGKLLKPLDDLVDDAARTWSEDKVVQKILAEIIEAAGDEALDKGVVNPPFEEFLKGADKGKKPIGAGQR